MQAVGLDCLLSSFSERMTGQSSAVPMWVASQDAENQSPEDLRYMKLTRSLEKESSAFLWICFDLFYWFHVMNK